MSSVNILEAKNHRLVLAKGRYVVPEHIDDDNEEIAAMFEGES